MIDIDNLTVGQVKEIQQLLINDAPSSQEPDTLVDMVGHQCIIRTCSAGVWYGKVHKKAGNEVIIENARRLWKWWAAQSISLSAVANYGVKPEKSSLAPSVTMVWLEAIEILPCTGVAIQSIEGCEDAEAR